MPNERGLAPLIHSLLLKFIAGFAQINCCRGEAETLDKMEDGGELDLAYINGWSLRGNIKILVKRPVSLFSNNI